MTLPISLRFAISFAIIALAVWVCGFDRLLVGFCILLIAPCVFIAFSNTARNSIHDLYGGEEIIVELSTGDRLTGTVARADDDRIMYGYVLFRDVTVEKLGDEESSVPDSPCKMEYSKERQIDLGSIESVIIEDPDKASVG